MTQAELNQLSRRVARSGRRSFLRAGCAALGGVSLVNLFGCTGAAQPASDRYTGFITVRLRPERFGNLITKIDDLRALAAAAGATGLSQLLNQSPDVVIRRLVSLTPSRIGNLERLIAQQGSVPRYNLGLYWRIDGRGISDRARFVELLSNLDEVEIAYQQPRGADPSVDPSDDTFALQHQFHLKEAPHGIGALWVWTQPGGSGASVAFVDVERGWIFAHEDLPPMKSLSGVSQEVVSQSRPHGTAVVGLVAGLDNATGIVGIAPTPKWVSVSSHVRAGVEDQVAEAIDAVASHMDPGDVLLVEWQELQSNSPAEVFPDMWTAIREATDKGIVVVECAGNGNDSLDGFAAIDKSNPVTDSGAIMVGACHAALDSTGQAHDRFVGAPNFGSNFGVRVDCHGFGERLATAGPSSTGQLNPGAPEDKAYRNNFGATSGAAAVVAGAAVVLQGMHKALKTSPLTPRDMRAALSTHGTPQGMKNPGHIGVLPDLKKVATALGLVSAVPSPPSNLRINR